METKAKKVVCMNCGTDKGVMKGKTGKYPLCGACLPAFLRKEVK